MSGKREREISSEFSGSGTMESENGACGEVGMVEQAVERRRGKERSNGGAVAEVREGRVLG